MFQQLVHSYKFLTFCEAKIFIVGNDTDYEIFPVPGEELDVSIRFSFC